MKKIVEVYQGKRNVLGVGNEDYLINLWNDKKDDWISFFSETEAEIYEKLINVKVETLSELEKLFDEFINLSWFTLEIIDAIDKDIIKEVYIKEEPNLYIPQGEPNINKFKKMVGGDKHITSYVTTLNKILLRFFDEEDLVKINKYANFGRYDIYFIKNNALYKCEDIRYRVKSKQDKIDGYLVDYVLFLGKEKIGYLTMRVNEYYNESYIIRLKLKDEFNVVNIVAQILDDFKNV